MFSIKAIRIAAREWSRARRVRGKTKYFCIGRNKTGTTSLQVAFKELGFIVGRQRPAEILCDKYYYRGEFGPIIEYCKTAQVFQDVPFSLPETYKHLDQAFPGSKFILSIRDSPEQWYQSVVRFQSKKFGRDGKLPTAEDLHNAVYVRKGWLLNRLKLYGLTEDDPYNKEQMIAHYEKHNREVREYFAERPGDLLVINLAEPGSYGRFLDFIGAKSSRTEFPWENRSK